MALHSQIDSHKIHEGYLYKKGQRFNLQFKRRYFVLYDDRTLDYFKGKPQSTSRTKAKGKIYLTQIARVELVQFESDLKEDRPTMPTTNTSDNFPKLSHSKNTPIISSIKSPPEYTEYIKERELLSKSLLEFNDKKHKLYVNQSVISPAQSGAECELTDDSLPIISSMASVHSHTSFQSMTSMSSLSSMSSMSSYKNKRIISGDIKNHHKSSANYIDAVSVLSPRDEFDAFNLIMNDTKLNLKCNRRYAFALISNDRQWILSAETNQDLKEWITLMNKLSQGRQIFDGYLNDKYFILFQNKVLNCYNKKKTKEIEFDIDLRHLLYLKFEKKSNTVTVALHGQNKNKKNNIFLRAISREIALEWFHKINSIFFDKYILKILYDSCAETINMLHNGQMLRDRYIAMYRDYIVIFISKKQLSEIKNMVFFDKNIFRDYTRKEKCILVPLNKNIKVRRASKNHGGRYTFLVSNIEGDRKWYFSVKTKQILKEWLCKLKPENNNMIRAAKIANGATKTGLQIHVAMDVEIESTMETPKSVSKSPNPDLGSPFAWPKREAMKSPPIYDMMSVYNHETELRENGNFADIDDSLNPEIIET